VLSLGRDVLDKQLLDAEGRVSETSTSNILIHEIGTGLISPSSGSSRPRAGRTLST